MAGRTVRVPQIMQMEAVECGAACLGMILAYYGRWVPLEQLRVDCGVSRDGANASNIVKAARTYGLKGSGKACSVKRLLQNVKPPCILFWNFTHFVVYTGVRGNKIFLNDPAQGQIMVSMQEFETSFTGIALLFEKTDAFQKSGSRTSALQSALRYLTGMKSPVLFVMCAAAVASLSAMLSTSMGRVFFDHILTGERQDWLHPLMIMLLALAAIWGIASLIRAYYILRIEGKTAVVNSSRFMRHLLRLPMEFYSQRFVGDLQQRQAANETIVSTMIGQVAPLLVNLVMLVFYLVIMIRYSLILTLTGIATIIVNAWLAHHLSVKRINIARSNAVNNSKLYVATVGGIGMIDTIKASGAEEGFFGQWAGYQAAANEDNVRMSEITERFSALITVVTSLVDILVLVFGVALIIKEQFTAGSLVAFMGFVAAFMDPVSQLILLGQTIQEMRTQIERIEDVRNYPADVPEEESTSAGENNADRKLTGELELKNVSFGYSPLEDPLIDHFDLHVKPGQWVALVGDSGSGKSTLAKLISGLYKPWSGEVLFDGKPAAEISREIMTASLAVVDQDIVVFEDTVLDNIRLWDRSIENYEVIMACRDACIHQALAKRQDGYSSQVLSGGSNFSGGELQRMELARALAQNPTLLILDEATSALDAEVEAQIIRHIRDLGITCIVVAHRLSTIRDCDEIIVLEDGKVAERGTHDELIARNGAYAELVRSN